MSVRRKPVISSDPVDSTSTRAGARTDTVSMPSADRTPNWCASRVVPWGRTRSPGWTSQPKLSTRNQLAGTVASIVRGEAMAAVKVELAGGQVITSSVTREAANDLALAEGSAATVLRASAAFESVAPWAQRWPSL